MKAVELGEEGSGGADHVPMRTDSVQVSNDALESQVRELIPESSWKRVPAGKTEFSTNRKKMRRARTKQFGDGSIAHPGRRAE